MLLTCQTVMMQSRMGTSSHLCFRHQPEPTDHLENSSCRQTAGTTTNPQNQNIQEWSESSVLG